MSLEIRPLPRFPRVFFPDFHAEFPRSLRGANVVAGRAISRLVYTAGSWSVCAPGERHGDNVGFSSMLARGRGRIIIQCRRLKRSERSIRLHSGDKLDDSTDKYTCHRARDENRLYPEKNCFPSGRLSCARANRAESRESLGGNVLKNVDSQQNHDNSISADRPKLCHTGGDNV